MITSNQPLEQNVISVNFGTTKKDALIDSIPSEFLEMKRLQAIIKQETQKLDFLKKKVIAEHFSDKDTLMTSDGVEIATYKTQSRLTLDQKSLKHHYPDLCTSFTVNTPVNTFLLKI